MGAAKRRLIYVPNSACATLFDPIRASRRHVQIQYFARFTFGDDFKRAAADFTIGRETLLCRARVHHQFKRLTAKRTSDVFGNFHAAI
jgi:hypothetical protein